MPYFRSLSKTAPAYNRNLPWPVNGQAYIAASMGPIAAGLFGGLLTAPWGIGIGLALGIGIAVLNGFLSDRYLDPLIARHQSGLLQMMPRVLINVAAFAWALLLSAISMAVPVLLFDHELLLQIR